MRLSLLVGACLALSASTARAQPADAEPAAAEAPTPEALVAEGVALRREGREDEALAKFQQAHELAPSARTHGQLGLTTKSLRQYVDAEKHLSAALEQADDPWIQKNREALELALGIVSKQLAWLTVEANVDGAELLVNGSPAATLPLEGPLRVAAGPLVIEVRAEGHEPAGAEPVVQAGKTAEVTLELATLPAELPPAPPPVAPEPTSPTPDEPPPDPPASWTPWIITAGAVGGVGLITGGVLGILTLDAKSVRDENCNDVVCFNQEGKDADERARAFATGSTVGFIVGGLGAAATLTLWLLEPDDATQVTVGPSGVWLRRSF